MLARHYRTTWVEEYAREYLEDLYRPYEFGDIVRIAKGQYEMEKKKAKTASKYLFCDTDMLVCKIWSMFKYGKTDKWIEIMTQKHVYDLYLLCDIDLPWIDDPLREHPHHRQELWDLYIQELRQMHVHFEVVSGTGQARLDKAISIIESTFMGNIQ